MATPLSKRYPPAQDSSGPAPASGPSRKPVSTTTASSNACPTCGGPDNVQLLEQEVRSLTEKYLTASNQLRELQEQNRRPTTSNNDARTDGTAEATSGPAAADSPLRPTGGLARFASFRLGTGGQTSSGNNNSSTPPAVSDVVESLQKALAKETAARVEAEHQVTVVNAELEDLSAQLFEEANQMVAVERKNNARLEERVAVLEKRAKDKSRRLERIELAHTRIERVRSLLDKG